MKELKNKMENEIEFLITSGSFEDVINQLVEFLKNHKGEHIRINFKSEKIENENND